jgi:asparagine synthase (glutamine-hydrolysing)
MCGIAGFAGHGERADLVRMTDAMQHRGPDGGGFDVHEPSGVHLGHRRLAVIDIAGGFQPMLSRDHAFSIVFNGEIYNFRELRTELEALGARFETDHSDTEVVLQGYRFWGEAICERLNGMWAFVIHDRERRRLFCSRDRFGKKPFFFHLRPGFFAFASELNALRAHPAVPQEINPLALRKYFAYGYVPAPATLFSAIRKLPGGHSLTLDLDTWTHVQARYWKYRSEPFEERPRNAEREWTEKLHHLLDAAVARRLVADVPVGAFLSGGVDSSTVAALAMRHVGRDRLKTFSIGFEEASFDESEYARAVANHIGATHSTQVLSVDQALEILPRIRAGMDEPINDFSLLPTYLLCRHARQQVTVALGGDGADELFAGYDPFKALRYAAAYDKLVPAPVHRGISMLAARLPVSHRYMSFDFRLKRTLRGLEHPAHLWLPVWMSPLSPGELEQLFSEPVDLEELYSEAITAWDEAGSADPVDRAIEFYLNLYMQDGILVKVDRASMMNSLEVRAPFLDIELVDFVRRLPSDVKLRGTTTKWLLKQMAEQLLPKGITGRRKQGFAMPTGAWFANGRLALDPAVSGNAAFWTRLQNEHSTHQYDHRLALQTQLAVETLFSQVVESPDTALDAQPLAHTQ